MHACLGGRPVLLAACDIGIEKPTVRDMSPKSAFDIWFAISDLLSNVISFYRPPADHTVGWEGEFPAFAAITGDKLRDDLDFATLGKTLSRVTYSICPECECPEGIKSFTSQDGSLSKLKTRPP